VSFCNVGIGVEGLFGGWDGLGLGASSQAPPFRFVGTVRPLLLRFQTEICVCAGRLLSSLHV